MGSFAEQQQLPSNDAIAVQMHFLLKKIPVDSCYSITPKSVHVL